MDKEHSLLLTHHIKPDYGFYVQGDDRLYVAGYSSVASLVVRFSGYFLSANGEVREYAIDLAPTSDRAVTSSNQTFGEGIILSCTARLLTGNANRGQCYVQARVQRSSGAAILPIVVLLGGYVTDDYSPSFPYGKIEGPLDGPGYLNSVTVAVPAAGAEISQAVPTGARWRPMALQFILTADANVATRTPLILYDDGTTVYLTDAHLATNTAGVGRTYAIGLGFRGINMGSSSGVAAAGLPPHLMGAGFRIRTSTTSIQVGDTYTAIKLLVEEWIEA